VAGVAGVTSVAGMAGMADLSGVEVWFADPADANEAAEALLDDGERARMGRFVFEKDRRLYLAAHALVRRTLSRHADVDPAAWRFATEEGGKPVIAGPSGAPPLRFNLSHCRGLVACAVARDREVGVDVEPRADVPEGLVDRICTPAEAAALRALPPSAQPDRFFTLWTLKEAYVKARGLGFALPVEQVGFGFGDGDTLRFEPDPALGEDPAAWLILRLHPTPAHCAALCVARPPAEITQHWAR
jgi:4'-phosphopantetheinyl transferase